MTGYYDGINDFKEEIQKVLNIDEDLPIDRILSLINTLMEEVDRLEDLEDNTEELKILLKEEKEKNYSLKKQIKLMQSINITENFVEKSKIRQKIEEIKNRKNEETCELALHGFQREAKIDILQELLEE